MPQLNKRKKFDPELHKAYDAIAKTKCIAWLATQGVEGKENPDQYSVDILCYRDDEHVGYAECEVKLLWAGVQWPKYFDTVQWPEGKDKFIKNSDKPVLMFMLNAQLNRALWADGKNVIESPLEEVHNKYKDDEKFFQVPLDKVNFTNELA